MSDTTTPRAYSYLRFSTPEQMRGDSYRRQTSLAEEYVARHGLVLDERLSFQDLGVSAFRGTNLKRGKLREFMRAVEDGIVRPGDYLLIESLDRLSREAILEAQGLFLQIISAGVVLVTLADGQAYSRDQINANPHQLYLSLGVMIRANEESATKARRLRAAWDGKRAKAKERPLTAMCPGWLELDRESGRFIVAEERAEVVRHIYEQTLAGLGQHAIAEALNREGTPTFGKAKLWHRSYVKKILGNPAVTGTMVPHQVDFQEGRRVRKPLAPVPDYYPAIVSQEDFQRVQAQLMAGRTNNRGGATGVKVQSLLAGLARCPLCGGTMTRVAKGTGTKAGKPYLVCAKAKAGAGCTYRAVPQHQVEEALQRNLPVILAGAPSGKDGLDERIEATEMALEVISDQIANLLEALMAGPSPVLNAKLRALEAEKEELEKDLRELGQQHQAAAGPFLAKRLDDLVEAMGTTPLDRSLANARLRQVFSGVVLDWREGSMTFQWKQGGQTSPCVVFAWPKDDQGGQKRKEIRR